MIPKCTACKTTACPNCLRCQNPECELFSCICSFLDNLFGEPDPDNENPKDPDGCVKL